MSASLTDQHDFDDARRGRIEGIDAPITNQAGRTVWDTSDWDFLNAEPPETVNPSLWRQSQLCAEQGLFEVAEGVYQIRGIDLSNMSLLEGERGVIVIDPLISAETAAAGLALYRKHRGNRPVVAVIYSHSHIDHFGGVLGVVDADTDTPILAPEGFMEHAVSENVYAGTAMLRRGAYYSGTNLKRDPRGLVGMGLGQATSTGTPGLLPPTKDITHTGQEEVIDGLRLVFQLTPGTEAPAEMNFLLPDRRALCMAENVTHTMHNILTLRGAQVRDARIWARYIDDAIHDFVPQADVVFSSHHWPTWGQDRMVDLLSKQRDMWLYMHDQTLRLLNQGYTGLEIAEMITMPAQLDEAWHTHGYYGSLSHNVKAIYQRYLGWYDGNPSSLWEHPPVETAKRYVECFGGLDIVLVKARQYIAAEDFRFAAQILKHAVFAEPDNREAKNLLADVYEHLAFGCENATWRNCYLSGALELREGVPPMLMDVAGSMTSALSVEQVFDSIGIRVDGPQAAQVSASIDWVFTDLGQTVHTELSHGAFVHWRLRPSEASDAQLTMTLTKAELLGILAGSGLDGIKHTGDLGALQRLMSVLDKPEPAFAIVTP